MTTPEKHGHWEQRYSAKGRRRSQPSPFIQAQIDQLGPPGRALDIACGDGRHSLALARRGHTVTAIDFARAGLLALRRSAAAEKLSIEAIQADLETYPLPADTFDLAIKAFYLQRNLFASLKTSLKVGGIAIVETFLVDQREIGHPRNPAFLLQRGELGEVFADFTPVEYREGLFSTGREEAYLARLVARKTRA